VQAIVWFSFKNLKLPNFIALDPYLFTTTENFTIIVEFLAEIVEFLAEIPIFYQNFLQENFTIMEILRDIAIKRPRLQ